MGIMAVFVIATVFLRYAMALTFAWAEEFITMLFIATTYFGAVIGVRDSEHISVDFLIEKTSSNVSKLIKGIVIVVVIFVQIVLIIYSWSWINKVGNVLTPGLRLPIKYFYYMLPLSAAFIILYELVIFKVQIINKIKKA